MNQCMQRVVRVGLALACVVGIGGCAVNSQKLFHPEGEGVYTGRVLRAVVHPIMLTYLGRKPESNEELAKKETLFSMADYRFVSVEGQVGGNLTGATYAWWYVVPVEAWDLESGDLVEVLQVEPTRWSWDPSSKKMPSILKVLCKASDSACFRKYRPSIFEQAYGQRSADQRDHIDRGLTFKPAKDMGQPERALLEGKPYVPPK